MRRVEHLINDIVFNTNNDGDVRYKPIRLLKYFNDAHRRIQGIVQSVQIETRQFTKSASLESLGNGFYRLPNDCYGLSSIISVSSDRNGDNTTSLVPKISEQELANGQFGYVVRRNMLYIPDSHGLSEGVRVAYNFELPNLSHRLFKIGQVLGNVISPLEEDGLFIEPENPLKFWDYISIVDDEGKILSDYGLKVTGWESSDKSLTLKKVPDADTLEYLKEGNWVCLGARATTHSPLPDALESLLCHYVERRVADTDKQVKRGAGYVKVMGMYEEEIALVRELFTKIDNDISRQTIVIDESNCGYFS